MGPFLEYVSASWDRCRRQINAVGRIQQKTAQFTNCTKDSDWETLAERRTIGSRKDTGFGHSDVTVTRPITAKYPPATREQSQFSTPTMQPITSN